MKNLSNLVMGIFCIILVTNCKKDTSTNINNGSMRYTPTHFVIVEDFELNPKNAYADSIIKQKTGAWILSDALVFGTNDNNDRKNGSRSVRLRSGKVGMTFDIDSIEKIVISHALYGIDKPASWGFFFSTDNGKTYFQIGNNITTSSTNFVRDTFIIPTSGNVRIEIRKSVSADKNRINIDDIIFIGKGNPHIQFNEISDVIKDTNLYNVANPGRDAPSGDSADMPPASGDNSNLLFGNPSNAINSVVSSADNYLIDFKYYVISYSQSRATPNWVCWHVDASNITNVTSRADSFASYIGLPNNFFRVESNSYVGSGFDRGHNCPSADRTSSKYANLAVFLMPNMIPQAPSNNQKTWANFEIYLRSEVQKGNEVYTIMGSYGSGGVGSKGAATTIANGRINVPKMVWKVAIILPIGDNDLNRVNEFTKIIAINTPNEESINPDWTKYITTIAEIEKATGYDLLSKLNTNIQKKIQDKLFVP